MHIVGWFNRHPCMFVCFLCGFGALRSLLASGREHEHKQGPGLAFIGVCVCMYVCMYVCGEICASCTNK